MAKSHRKQRKEPPKKRGGNRKFDEMTGSLRKAAIELIANKVVKHLDQRNGAQCAMGFVKGLLDHATDTTPNLLITRSDVYNAVHRLINARKQAAAPQPMQRVSPKNSEEMAVLKRIVNPSVAEGETLISLVGQMNLFRPRKRDVLADETLESINTLTAKRKFIGKVESQADRTTIRNCHEKYVIELHKYAVELFKKCVRKPYNKESRQLLNIFETNAGQVPVYVQNYRKNNAEAKMERKRRNDEKMDMNQFKRLSALADKEIESRRERIDQTTFKSNTTW